MQRAGLKREVAHDRAKWREGVQTIAVRNIQLPPLTGTKPEYNWNHHGGGATRPLPRDGGVEELHGDPTVGPHPKVWTRGQNWKK